MAGIDTAVPNRVVGEALRAGAIAEVADYARVRPEVKYGEKSRIDFLLSGPGLPDADPPYKSGEAALRDGWFLLQSAQLIPPPPGLEHTNSYLEHEFVFERRVDV